MILLIYSYWLSYIIYEEEEDSFISYSYSSLRVLFVMILNVAHNHFERPDE